MNNQLAAKLLRAYRIADQVDPTEIDGLTISKSQRYALTDITSFNYAGRHFYVSDDYSLDDNPDRLRLLLEDTNHLLGGQAIKNPIPQADGALYALGLDGTEYYLWEDTGSK